MIQYKPQKEIQEKWIQAIKDCGRSLIDNAEKIAGDYDLQTSVTISIELVPNKPVEICINTCYLPKSQNKTIITL